MMMKVAVPQRFKLRVVPDVKTLIFGSGREVHYIGGTEVLPPPLLISAYRAFLYRLFLYLVRASFPIQVFLP